MLSRLTVSGPGVVPKAAAPVRRSNRAGSSPPYRRAWRWTRTFGESGLADVPLSVRADRDVALDASGKLLVAGAGHITGKDSGALLRLNADGTPDPAFNNGQAATLEPATESSTIHWHAALPLGDGGTLVAGEQRLRRTDGTFERRPILARYNPDGSLDRSYGGETDADGFVLLPGGSYSGLIEDLALLPSGKVLAAGNVREQIGDYDYARGA